MRLKRLVLTGIVLLLLSNNIFSQVQTARTISMVPNSSGFYEYLPAGYNSSTQNYPLIVFVHGAGELGSAGSQLSDVLKNGIPKLINLGTFPTSFVVNSQTFRFIVISPQFQDWPVATDIDSILNYVVQHYRVDQTRIYLTGLSMGGGITWDYAGGSNAYANRVAAILPVAGASYPDLSKGRTIAAANLPVWATHNIGDPTVLVSYTNDYITNINQAPSPTPLAKKTIFPVNGHDAWTQTYDPTWKEDSVLNVYQWMLQYTRPAAGTGSNQPPLSNAGVNKTIFLPTSTISLTGTGTDTDGTVVSYAWTQINGTPATITNPSSPSTTITGLTTTGTRLFALTVTDNLGATGISYIAITVKPVAKPVPGRIEAENWDGKLGYQYPVTTDDPTGGGQHVVGINNGSWMDYNVNVAATGTYTISFRIGSTQTSQFQLKSDTTVLATFNLPNTGGWSNWLTASFTVPLTAGSQTVRLISTSANNPNLNWIEFAYSGNPPPTATAGTAQTISLPASQVTLSGSGTSGIGGGSVTYAWTQISGTAATITNAASASTIVTGLTTAGTRVFRLTVTQSDNQTATSDITVTVNSAPPPTANAGTNQTIALPVSQISLAGTGTVNNGGTITYAWTRVSGPNTSPALTIVSPASATTLVTGLIQGTYIFRLTITQSDNQTATSDVTVTVNSAPPPTASAGINQIITLPTTQVSLTGSGTANNGGTITYAWTQVSGTAATITNASSAATTVTGLTTAGARVFRLTVTQSDNQTATGDITVTVNSAPPPTANAGIAQTIVLPVSQVSLTGSGTANNGGSIVSYAWTQVSGTAATITNALSASTTVTGLTTAGVRVFRLTVTDNLGATATNDVTVTVNTAPGVIYVSANNPQTISTSTASLTSTVSGNTGTTTTKWTKFSVPGQTIKKLTVIGSSTAAGNGATVIDSAFVYRLKAFYISQGIITTITNLAVAGQSQWDLTDNNAALLTAALNTSPDVMLMAYPSNAYPYQTFPAIMAKFQQIADSCTARGITLYISGTQPRNDYSVSDRQKLVTINDSLRLRFPNRFIDFLTPLNNTIDNTIKPEYGSGDGIHPNNAGHAVIYEVTKAANIFQTTISSASVIVSPANANTSITGLVTGVHQFQVSVVDNLGFAATAIAKITTNIAIQPPTASAGTTQTIILPVSQVSLTGSGTANNGGSIIAYAWTQLSGTGATITNTSSASTTVTGLTTAGARVFRLTVTQNDNQTATSDITITVNNAPPPTANAGTNQSITLPTAQVSLTGSGIVNNGGAIIYAWTQLSGTAATITNPASAFTTVTGLTTAGTRVFRLTVTQSDNQTATSDITITVNNAPPPTANAGTNQTITLPTAQVSLTGSGIVNNGGAIIYTWTQLSGTAATITNAASAATTVTGLTTAGARVFRLTVTQSDNQTATSDVTITVNNAVAPPTANAGINQTITLPTAQVSLTGSGTVSNGGAIIYAWTQVSGTAATITNASSASTTVTGLTTAGARVFRLTVTQSDNQTATSDITITVNNAPPPTANAGTNQTITLPTAQVSLTGSGTVSNGGAITYTWTRVSGPNTSPALTIVSPASATTSVTGLIQGVYIFRLTVTQSDNQTATSDVTVTVNNTPAPTANAGTNQTITLPVSQVNLTGSGTVSNGGAIIYAWTEISGPNNSPALTIVSPASATTSVTGLIQGSYVFRLTVTQSDNQAATSDITITVNPVVVVSNGKTIPGRIEAEAWDAKSGGQYAIPTTDVGGGLKVVNITNGNSMDYNVNVLNTGSYTVGFRIATTKGNAQFQIKSGATVLATINIPNTFGWDNWQTITVSNVPLTAGNQTIRIQSTNNDNCDFNWVEYSLAGNQPPTANAGINQTITLPLSQVSLTGSGTDPESGVLTYAWTQTGGTAATITSPATAATTITGLTTAGVRTFRLTVTDDHGATATGDVTVTVNNAPAPTANAGTNQTITLPVSQISLTGSGTVSNGGAITYAWTRVSGPNTSPALTIVSPTTATTSVTGLIQGSYVFRLTVTQSDNQTATSDVTVTVNNAPPPTANAGTNQTITLPTAQVSLTGSGTVSNGGAITYAWTQVSGTTATITNVASASTTVTGLTTAGARVFRLTVTQSDNQTATSDVTVTVNNTVAPPTANAGTNQTITLPTTQISLTGSGTVSNGGAITYAWTQVSGTTATITNAASASTTVTGLTTAGARVFRLTVTQSDNQTATSDVTVIVNNAVAPPTANAGTNQTITLPTTQISLTGSGTVSNGGAITYAWTRVSGPNTSPALTIVSPTTAATSITGLIQGSYVFRLTVTQSDNQTATSDVTVTVNNAVAPPTANAGTNQTITLPLSQVSLTGTGTVSNGGAITYAWTRVSGPNTSPALTIVSPTTAATSITGLIQGSYVFRLTVTQSDNQTATSDVTVTVNNAVAPPTANAGTNQTITLPTTQISLTGSGTVSNGGAITYAWTRVSGPNNSPALTIVSPTTAATSITGLIQGTYVFRLTVTQSDNQTATSDVTVTVNNAPAPTANAGTNQTITLPVSQVSLTGSGTVSNGGAITYAWTRISGPNTSPALTITSPASATTSVTGLIQGVYVFRLTVTQSDNQSATSDITITVNPVVVVSNGKTIPGRIEAEAWDAKSGGQYAIPTTDVGGGLKVVNITNGNSMDYNVNVLNTGNYTVGFRIATTKGKAQFQIKSGTTVLATVNIPNTFGWDNWTTFTVSNVPLTAGNQTITIQSTNDENCDFNWMEYALVSAATGNGTNLFAAARSSTTDNIATPVITEKQKPVADQTGELFGTSTVELFPNPVYDQFIIKVNNEYAGKMKIQIINGAGKVMKEIQSAKNKGTDQTILSADGLQRGTYIIRIQMGEWTKSIKMIKL